MTFPMPFIGGMGVRDPAAAVFRGRAGGFQSGNSVSWGSFSLGTPSDDRKIVVGISVMGTNSGATFDSATVTVAGIPATRVHSGTYLGVLNSGNDAGVAFFIAEVPTGTTGTVTASGVGGNATFCDATVWSTTGVVSMLPYSRSTGTTGAQQVNLTMDVKPGGLVFAVIIAEDTTAVTYTWTGVTGNSGSTLDLDTSGTNNIYTRTGYASAGSVNGNAALAISGRANADCQFVYMAAISIR